MLKRCKSELHKNISREKASFPFPQRDPALFCCERKFYRLPLRCHWLNKPSLLVLFGLFFFLIKKNPNKPIGVFIPQADLNWALKIGHWGKRSTTYKDGNPCASPTFTHGLTWDYNSSFQSSKAVFILTLTLVRFGVVDNHTPQEKRVPVLPPAMDQQHKFLLILWTSWILSCCMQEI